MIHERNFEHPRRYNANDRVCVFSDLVDALPSRAVVIKHSESKPLRCHNPSKHTFFSTHDFLQTRCTEFFGSLMKHEATDLKFEKFSEREIILRSVVLRTSVSRLYKLFSHNFGQPYRVLQFRPVSPNQRLRKLRFFC